MSREASPRRAYSRSPVRRDDDYAPRVAARSRSPRRDRSASPRRARDDSPRDRRRQRSRSVSRERRRSPSRERRRRSPTPPRRQDDRYSDRYRRDSRSPPRRRSRSRSRDRGGHAVYGNPGPRVPPRVGLQVFVAGFNFLSNERDVERRFGRYGRVTEVRIARDLATGKSRGFGFVAYETEEEARACIAGMDGVDWEGRRLQVELCRNPR